MLQKSPCPGRCPSSSANTPSAAGLGDTLALTCQGLRPHQPGSDGRPSTAAPPERLLVAPPLPGAARNGRTLARLSSIDIIRVQPWQLPRLNIYTSGACLVQPCFAVWVWQRSLVGPNLDAGGAGGLLPGGLGGVNRGGGRVIGGGCDAAGGGLGGPPYAAPATKRLFLSIAWTMEPSAWLPAACLGIHCQGKSRCCIGRSHPVGKRAAAAAPHLQCQVCPRSSEQSLAGETLSYLHKPARNSLRCCYCSLDGR